MASSPVGGDLAVALRWPADAASTARRRDEADAVTLGPDVGAGQQPQVVIPAGAWQAARPAGDQAVLVSCVVSPGFDFADFTHRC